MKLHSNRNHIYRSTKLTKKSQTFTWQRWRSCICRRVYDIDMCFKL